MTPYQRIVRAARVGRGCHLSAQECASMAGDSAVTMLADNDDAQEALRRELLTAINRHVGVGQRTRPATSGERRLRAHQMALDRLPYPVAREWTPEQIVERIIEREAPA